MNKPLVITEMFQSKVYGKRKNELWKIFSILRCYLIKIVLFVRELINRG